MERARLRDVVRATGCAEERGGIFFLCDPRWGAAERVRAAAAMAQAAGRGAAADEGWLCVPTGGTSGGVKFARHDEGTFGAAVRGFCAHFGVERANAVDVLPGFHVSGLMARVRSAATGGAHVAWPWKELEAGRVPSRRADEAWTISLVPTQLQRLLAAPEAVAWLRGFAAVFVGGGPMWAELAEAAARAELRLAPCYGMTETAAMVAALRPEEFLAGARSSGAALPHARIVQAERGTMAVEGESVFRGYFPAVRAERRFETEDRGRIDECGHWHVLGRRDAAIVTGGKKVWPEEVEAALRATGFFAEVAVVGVPDAEWGEAVVACFPAGERAPDFAAVRAKLEGLAAFQRPKRFVAVSEWPRNEQGKVNRRELVRMAKEIRLSDA